MLLVRCRGEGDDTANRADVITRPTRAIDRVR
jgi:hypothetical protein